MEKLILDKMSDRIDGFFVGKYEEEIIFFLTGVKFRTIYSRKNIFNSSAFSRIEVLKEIEINNKIYEDAAVITFSSLNQSEIDFLKDIIESVYLNKENLTKDIGEIYEIMTAMIISLREQKLDDKKKEIGVMGEILTLVLLSEYDNDIVKKLVGNSSARFDISIDEETKVEVKTTNKNERIHTFKIKQIKGRERIHISSVVLEEDDSGLNLNDILIKFKDIVERISFEKLIEIKTISKLVENNKDKAVKINLDKTIDAIKFYNAVEILEENIQGGANNKSVRKLSVVLNEDDNIQIEEIFNVKKKV